MEAKRCVVTLASEEKQYPAGLARLERSLKAAHFDGEFLPWRPGEYPEGSPPRSVTPYAFKAFCLMEARRRGFDSLLWLDSSCVPVRRLELVFQRIELDGYVLFRDHSFTVGQWCSDVALTALGVDREEAMTWPGITTAAIGVSMRTSVGREFLDRWFEAAREGTAFRGIAGKYTSKEEIEAIKWNRDQCASKDPRVLGHRWEQTVAGVLARRLGMTPISTGLGDYSTSMRRIEMRTRIVLDRDVAQPSPTLRTYKQIRRDKYLGYFASPPDMKSLPRRLIRGSVRRLIRAQTPPRKRGHETSKSK
jgi:hypothetical protein